MESLLVRVGSRKIRKRGAKKTGESTASFQTHNKTLMHNSSRKTVGYNGVLE